MIIPQYWAEQRVQQKVLGRQATVRRFGWSDQSQAAAEQHAFARCQAALQQIEDGEEVPRIDARSPYNGAEGMPIREEIISRHGNTIITRNGHGARCLNTENVLFADVDFDDGGASANQLQRLKWASLLALVLGGIAYWRTDWLWLAFVAAVLTMGFAMVLIGQMQAFRDRNKGDVESRALARIRDFALQNPLWNLAVYRTPAGLRALATHATFQTSDPAVAEFFQAIGTDPLYVRMCLNQHCFRARVSAKPWRLQLGERLKPRRNPWPVPFELQAARDEWIAKYEAAAQSFAACRFIENIGSGVVHIDVAPVQALHDDLSRARFNLSLA